VYVSLGARHTGRSIAAEHSDFRGVASGRNRDRASTSFSASTREGEADFTIPIAINPAAKPTDRLKIIVRYQVCNVST